jgi:hypothetical protein
MKTKQRVATAEPRVVVLALTFFHDHGTTQPSKTSTTLDATDFDRETLATGRE